MEILSTKDITELKEKLVGLKASLGKSLESFASQDPNLKGDWDARFPSYDNDASLEEAANEVEEYATNLPIEHSLELRLQAISNALEKIEKGTYGACEHCGKPIDIKRLQAYPEAKFCRDCSARRA
ncbi:MAG: TraR/DksA C4-type zinc finger protein [Candidatus Spechtbacteria bacterium]|nr:TraR/DksA C4-type zinc finger protein [Candidatus Spechtbacteria bacterium]